MRRDLIGETLLNQFRVETFIASGGMATIYRVWDLQRSVPLAMKVLHPELAEDPSFIARFQREAQSLQMLVHPHIVPFYGLYRVENLTFLLERYIDGPTLDEVLRARAGRPLTLREALIYFKALYTSLGYAHAQGIIHCDVKPGNVLIDQGGHVYLTDFGIARFMDTSITTSSAMGTPLYMAPEQINGERVTPQTDIYSLGVVMFELLTGRRPFRGDAGVPPEVGGSPSDRIRYQHLYAPPPDPRGLNRDLPHGVAAIILKAMAKDPGDRFPSVQAMAQSLSQVVAARFETLGDRVSLPETLYQPGSVLPTEPAPPPGGGIPWPPETRPEPPPTAQRKAAPGPRRILWLLGLAAVIALCGLLGSQLVRAVQRGGLPAAPTGLPGEPTAAAGLTAPAAPDPTATVPPSAPTATAADEGLSDFPVAGQIAISRRQEGVTQIFLLDAASGQQQPLPGVPNVTQREMHAAQWSPDGRRLTWTSQYNGRLHVVAHEVEGSGAPYQLPAGERYERVSSPAFLPDGQRISFWALGGGRNLLVIADAASGELLEEIQLPAYRNLFVWNWREDLVAFASQTGGVFKVLVSGAPDGGARPVDPGGEGYAPAWSNDGQWIAFQSGQGRQPGMNEIWIARADGTELRQVTSTPEDHWSRAPTWSPDGRMIAFVSDRSGSIGADFGELFVVDLESGRTRQMTSSGGSIYDWRPAWWP